MQEVKTILNKTITASIENLREAVDFIENGASSFNIEQNDLWKIRLASEEAIVNIIDHGKNPKGLISIRCHSCIEDKFYIIISDYGFHFDHFPHAYNVNNTKHTLSSLPIGNLGIKLIYSVMNEVYYLRENKKNILIMVKEVNNHAYLN